jgi:hypothetical protein
MPGATRGSARSTVSCEHANRSMFCAEADCAKSVPAARVFQCMVKTVVAKDEVTDSILLWAASYLY